MSSAAIDNATSCHVVDPLISSSGFDVDASLSGLAGTNVPRPSHDIGGGGGNGVSKPFGASCGTVARYGYLWNSISRTGRVKSMNSSSIDAFSLEFTDVRHAVEVTRNSMLTLPISAPGRPFLNMLNIFTLSRR